MKVILLQDVKKQGKKDEIIEVSDGYANNFLIKNKLAVPYTKISSKILNNELDEREKQEEKNIEEVKKIKEQLAKKTINFNVKTGNQDKVFGSISSKQIADELKKMGFNIDKKKIRINNPIDVLGIHKIEIELHKKVIAEVNVNLKK